MRKVIFLILAIICIVLGIIGVILPVMPGLIFFVAASYFLSKSSQTLYLKLLRLPIIGKSIQDWHDYGVMTLSTKLGLISFFWVSCISSMLFTSQNYAYPIFISNLALIFTFTVLAIDQKI